MPPYSAYPQNGDRARTVRYRSMDTDIVHEPGVGPPKLVCICNSEDAARILSALNLASFREAAARVREDHDVVC